jgi:hypothetical protein
MRCYYIGVDESGRKVKGEAIIDLLDQEGGISPETLYPAPDRKE